MGYFGFTTQPPRDGKKVPPQFRHKGVIDIDEAHASVADVLAVWRSVVHFPEAQPFSGGVWDAWPRRLSQGVALLRSEMQAVTMYLREVVP